MYEIVIIDDKFPYNINADITDEPIPQEKIESWVNTGDWGKEHDLKGLIDQIISSNLYKHKEITILGFLYPQALLGYLKKNKSPQLIIFDWEYLTQQKETLTSLIEIIGKTTSYIFIYTALADKIWQLLNGDIFEKNIDRIQLLLKGDKKLSLFTSEDNIMQFIISHFEAAHEFKMGESSVRFEKNTFINVPSDLLLLESILGRDVLLQKLKESNFEISERTMKSMFSDLGIKFYRSKDEKYLLDSNRDSNEEIYGPLREISFLDALSKFGIKLIDKTLERGITLTEP